MNITVVSLGSSLSPNTSCLVQLEPDTVGGVAMVMAADWACHHDHWTVIYQKLNSIKRFNTTSTEWTCFYTESMPDILFLVHSSFTWVLLTVKRTKGVETQARCN